MLDYLFDVLLSVSLVPSEMTKLREKKMCEYGNTNLKLDMPMPTCIIMLFYCGLILCVNACGLHYSCIGFSDLSKPNRCLRLYRNCRPTNM